MLEQINSPQDLKKLNEKEKQTISLIKKIEKELNK